MNSRQQSEQRLMVVTGIIQQLMYTRTQKLFKNFTISTSEFSLLSHLSHNPERSWIISELVEVMEMNQPGITKLVASLCNKSAINIDVDEFDKRKRHLTITPQGLQLCNEVMQKLQPDISLCFSDWHDNELQKMLVNSEKLMKWLDKNRL